MRERARARGHIHSHSWRASDALIEIKACTSGSLYIYNTYGYAKAAAAADSGCGLTAAKAIKSR